MQRQIVVLYIFLIFLVSFGCSKKEDKIDADMTNTIMPAYTIINVIDMDGIDGYMEYTKAHLPAMAQYGGRFLAESSKPIVIEGNRPPGKFFLLQKWTELKAFNKWYRSGEYALIKQIQRKAVKANIGILNSAQMPSELAGINVQRPAPKAVYAFLEILKIHDKFQYRKYLDGWRNTVKEYNGRILAQDKNIETLEGKFSATDDYILTEWPDLDSFYIWYDSEQYLPLRQLLSKTADFNLYLINSADMRPELNW